MTRRETIALKIAEAQSKRIVLPGWSACHLGDILCISSLPRLFVQQRGIRIYIATHPNTVSVFLNNPFIAGFAKSGSFAADASAMDHGHVLQRILQGLRFPIEPIPKPEIYLSKKEIAWALNEKNNWPRSRPVCILSSAALSDRGNLAYIDWNRVANILNTSYTVVQPTICEATVAGAIPYRNLTTRQYMALFSVADFFVGGTSGGSHIAAAFDVPSLIIAWRSLLNIQFPVSGNSLKASLGNDFKASFLYPQHWFISSEDLQKNHFDEAALHKLLENVVNNGRRGRLLPFVNHPKVPLGFKPRTPPYICRIGSGRSIRLRH